MPVLTASTRRSLRETLLETAPWLSRTEVGPRAVEAGTCRRCDHRPAMLPTCGPVAWTALCPPCADAVGDDGWCDGHVDDGRAARGWARALPSDWPVVAHLWWIATGEVRPDDDWVAIAREVAGRQASVRGTSP